MLDWILSWLMPSTMPLEGSKTPLEALKSSREYRDNPKA
jgi:hypothetical protein